MGNGAGGEGKGEWDRIGKGAERQGETETQGRALLERARFSILSEDRQPYASLGATLASSLSSSLVHAHITHTHTSRPRASARTHLFDHGEFGGLAAHGAGAGGNE